MGKGESGYSKRELERLFRQAHQGQPEAREEIFSFLHTRFLLLAKLRLLEQDAEDVVQETLMVIDDRFEELETVSGLLAFANEVLRNKIGNFYRRRDRRKRYQVGWDETIEVAYEIEGEFDAAELDRLVMAALDRLGQRSPRCRLILLGLCEGLSVAELSQRVGLPRPKIDDWIFRCRQALRRILREEYGLRL